MESFDQNNDKLDDPDVLLDLMWDTLYQDFSKMPFFKPNLKNDLLNAINYYKGLKSTSKK